MKTQILIDIKTMDLKECHLTPDFGVKEDQYTQKELLKFRKEYVKYLHETVLDIAREIISSERTFIDGLGRTDLWFPGLITLKDFRIKIKSKILKNETKKPKSQRKPQ